MHDLTYIAETAPDHKAWTSALAKFLTEIKVAVETARNNSQTAFTSQLREHFLSSYDVILVNGEEAVCGSPKIKSRRLTATNLRNSFVKCKAEVLRFMTDFTVPFDNNGCERDLRMLKLQQKIAGCFLTTEGVTIFCRVRSYLSSVKKPPRGT